MNTNLRRLIPLFTLASCAIVAPAFAYDNDDTTKEHGKVQHAVPPAQYPGGADALSFFVGVSYTYWLPYQEGITVAYDFGSAGAQTSAINPVMDGVSGFKVSLGANTHHDGWTAALNYTWFNVSPAMTTNTLESGVVTYWSPFILNDPANINAVASQFKTQFNRIDAMINRSFYAGHYLAFRPWLGLLGAWDLQNLNFNLGIEGSTNQDIARIKQNWWGVGPYAGAEATYYFANEWGLFISSGASLLLANHTMYYDITVVDEDNQVVGVPIRNTKDNIYGVEPMLETSLGLRWDSFWTDWALRIDLAWELQTYFSHVAYQGLSAPATNRCNFSTQGLTLGVRVNF